MIKSRKTAISVLAGVFLALASTMPAYATDYDIAPTQQLTGAATQLSNPCYIEKDSSGNLYVSDTNNATITVYAAGATGNTAPIRTLTGGNSLITNPYGMALDSSGRLYVVDGLTSKILVFAAGANGGDAPIHTISVGAQAYDLEWNPISGDLVVSEYGQIESFSNPLSATTPSHTLTTGTGHTLGLAIDAAGGMYVADTFVNRIMHFASFSSVNPDRTISGSNTGFDRPWDIEVDRASGTLLIANSEGTRAVLSFTGNADGNIAPEDSIKGTNPALSQPAGLLQSSASELLVMDRANAALKTFSLSGIVPVAQSGNSQPSGGQNANGSTAQLSNTGLNVPAPAGLALFVISLGIAVIRPWKRWRSAPRR